MTDEPGNRHLPVPAAADRRPSLARVAVDPASVVAAGAGVVVGILAGLPAAAIVALAVACWAIRMMVAVARRPPPPKPIDPYALVDPWRQYVKEALNARARLGDTLAHWPPGPLRDRLSGVDARVAAAVEEIWRVANQAAAVEATAAQRKPDDIGEQLRGIQKQRAALAGSEAEERRSALERSEESLAAQLRSVRRLEDAGRRADDRLRTLTAQLNAAVASIVDLSLQIGDPERSGELAGNVDAVVADLDALREAVQEAETQGGPSDD